MNTLTAPVKAYQIKDVIKCIDNSKWLICNMFFPKCIHNTTINRWKYIPLCQETCHSFLKTKHCLPITNFAYFAWGKIGSACPEIIEKNGIINCSVYPKSGSRECLYNLVGKLVVIISYMF